MTSFQSTSAYRVQAIHGHRNADGTKRYHAVPVGAGTHARAICGKRPIRQSLGWGYSSTDVTCATCLQELLK